MLAVQPVLDSKPDQFFRIDIFSAPPAIEKRKKENGKLLTRKKLVVKNGHVYRVALNKKNAARHFGKRFGEVKG